MSWPKMGELDSLIRDCLASGRYVATKDGHILNTNYRLTRRPHLIAEKLNVMGYLQCNMQHGKRRSGPCVHRVICWAFHGAPPDASKFDVNHINGIKTDNRPENLEWVTAGENISHAHAKHLRELSGSIGRGGEDHHNARLTADNVTEIFNLRARGLLHREIAEIFRVNERHISRILRGASWKGHPCNASRGPSVVK